MQGEAQAIQRVGPAPASSSLPNRAFRIPANVGGTANWTIPGMAVGQPGCWITITNIGTAATDLLAFSCQASTQPGGIVIADSANDFVIPPGATVDYWVNTGMDTVRFAGPATAIASCHRSSI